mmetsp:Transcript_122149/g.216266  ORF Transcript_122149/g.216266 Transcript_122149/m.216266 type:complete len:203 (+) Transcript_122149:240-848(+)
MEISAVCAASICDMVALHSASISSDSAKREDSRLISSLCVSISSQSRSASSFDAWICVRSTSASMKRSTSGAAAARARFAAASASSRRCAASARSCSARSARRRHVRHFSSMASASACKSAIVTSFSCSCACNVSMTFKTWATTGADASPEAEEPEAGRAGPGVARLRPLVPRIPASVAGAELADRLAPLATDGSALPSDSL